MASTALQAFQRAIPDRKYDRAPQSMVPRRSRSKSEGRDQRGRSEGRDVPKAGRAAQQEVDLEQRVVENPKFDLYRKRDPLLMGPNGIKDTANK